MKNAADLCRHLTTTKLKQNTSGVTKKPSIPFKG